MNVEYAGQRILVTGASAGIGMELARQLAAAGPKCLMLVARRKEQLKELARTLEASHPGVTVAVMPCDLSDQAAIDALIRQAQAEHGGVDILINNAGSGDYELFENERWGDVERMIKLNITGLTYLSHRLLGPMLARGQGGILNISSVMGLMVGPGRSVYSASKHYVSALSEALRVELRGTGVVVSQVCPGPVESEFAAIAGSSNSRPGWLEIDAATCARESLEGFARGQALIIPGSRMRLAAVAIRALPQPLKRLAFARVRAQMLAKAASASPSAH